jgi:hypothetical protein
MNTKAIAILEVVTSPSDSSVRSLEAGKVLSLTGKHDRSVYCLYGVLWVTREGNSEDILVRAGETRAIPGCGRLVISALENSRLWVA